jgi:hypothetical protein
MGKAGPSLYAKAPKKTQRTPVSSLPLFVAIVAAAFVRVPDQAHH